MILRLYQLITCIAGPLIDLYLLKRKKEGKEDPQRYRERSGYAASPRPAGMLLWVHAASVGESLSVLPLIKKLATQYPDGNILLTTGTVTSARLVASRLPDNAFHQYVPVDHILAVSRFLKHWQPNLALWVESELWPNLVTETGKYCPMILINGRISDDSYVKWQRYKALGQHMLSRFALALPQSEHDAKRLEELGARNVKYIGNIKFDAPPLAADPKKMGELINEIGDRQVWLAASTHPGEEDIIGQIHEQLKEAHPELLTIIVPRHPQRSKDIARELSRRKLKIAVRSEGQKAGVETDIYIADTMGELGIFYRLVPIVFIGGSLVEHGGQNPLEAARLECAIILGPHMENFTEITRELEQKNAVISVTGKDQLRQAVDELFNAPDQQHALSSAAMAAVEEKNGVLDAVIEEITPYIQKISSNSN